MIYQNKFFGVLIICYQPNYEDIYNIKKNISSFNCGGIVWNSKKIFNISNPNFFQIELNTNLGQAKALNIGFSKAKSLGINILLTLDQDSILIEKSDRIIDLINYYSNNYRNPSGFNFLSIKDNKSNNYSYSREIKPYPSLTTVTSGTIYLISAWEKIKGFKEKYFIEGVDTEYSLKAKKNKFNFYKIDYPIIIHDAGIPISKKVLKFKLKLRMHSDIRVYLQYRNNFSIIIKYFLFFPKWAIKTSFNLFTKKTLISIFVSRNAFKTFIWILRGIYHACIEFTPYKKKLKSQEFIFKSFYKLK
tara:strand:- start:65 stop:973 length:909 start_codon:yes stop_codon:yes gene_type:complete